MNEVMNAILTRRSIRKFTDAPIPKEILKDIVDAALHAPSGKAMQTWQFTMITNGTWSREDNACALENAFLAAHSHGVGSVWINQMLEICDAPAIRALLDELGVPAGHTVYGMAALGYAAPDAPVRPMERTGKVVYVE